MSRELALGPSHPVQVIAEIGVNHDGSAEIARKLIRGAKEAGADAVKLQVFRTERLMHRSAEFAKYQKKGKDASPIAMLKRYELSDSVVMHLAGQIRRCGMWPVATPFSPRDLGLIKRMELPAIKIASPDLVNKPLLEGAAKLGRPLLLSTGAATIDEVDQAAAWMVGWGAPFALLHCISSYPTKTAEANLSWIGQLRDRYGVPVGYSDHTTELAAGACAVAAGAKLVEKHLTYDRAAAGPDHAASFDGGEFTEYVRMIRAAEAMLGKPGKRVLKCEEDVRRVSRQSVVAIRAIARNAKISLKDLTVQRPGTGIAAAELEAVVGRRAGKKIAAGEMLSWEMVQR